jgi:hypothetical protein
MWEVWIAGTEADGTAGVAGAEGAGGMGIFSVGVHGVPVKADPEASWEEEGAAHERISETGAGVAQLAKA